MSLGPRFWTRVSVEYVEDLRKGLADFDADLDAGSRVGARVCKTCFYLKRGRIAGQAFTHWRCDFCEVEPPPHHNTDVPRVCTACSDTHSLCVRCSGDLDLLEDRSAFPVPVDRRALRRPQSSGSAQK